MSVRLIFGGDVMLGRIVKEAIKHFGYQYPLGPVADLMRQADLTIINLECAITDSEKRWSGHTKSFYFGAPSDAIHTLIDAGVDIVSLANNHALDYDFQGLLDTLTLLKKHKILQAGAGRNLAEAQSIKVINRKGIKFGMVAFCDHQDDFAARDDRPGIAYLDLKNEKKALSQFEKSLKQLQLAKVDWPILSLHWGYNMVDRPSEYFVHLAHAAIDMGYKILFGHSAHVFHGIEIYKNCPILYAAGDFVDDYYVDSFFKNDHQLLFELELNKKALKKITAYPLFISECQTKLAKGKEFEYIAEKFKLLCQEMGTTVIRAKNKLLIALE